MKILKYWLFAAVIAIGGYYAVELRAAELLDKDYPYWIFDDEGVVRYCMEPDVDDVAGDTTPCFTGGVKTDCKLLEATDGFIDCKK